MFIIDMISGSHAYILKEFGNFGGTIEILDENHASLGKVHKVSLTVGTILKFKTLGD
jgi:hypothetical protein